MAPPSNVIVLNSHLNSGPEENPNNTIDEKKRKRMISNKEYSRKYRLRKQQGMDELRAKVANLSAENNMLLTRLNFVRQNYMKLHEKNILLKSHALKHQKNDTHRPEENPLPLVKMNTCAKEGRPTPQDTTLAEFIRYMDSILLFNKNGDLVIES